MEAQSLGVRHVVRREGVEEVLIGGGVRGVERHAVVLAGGFRSEGNFVRRTGGRHSERYERTGDVEEGGFHTSVGRQKGDVFSWGSSDVVRERMSVC